MDYLSATTISQTIAVFFSQQQVTNFFLGYMAKKGLDGVLGIISYAKNNYSEQSLEFQLVDALDESLRETCEYFSWEYDNTAIPETFATSWESLGQVSSIDELRSIFENAIEPEDGFIDDKVLKYWISSFHKQSAKRNELNNFIVERKIDTVGRKIDTVLENQVPINKTIDFTMSYDEAYQNAIHSSHAYDIAPEKLYQRDDELKLLNEICSNNTGYFLFEANAYTGKSALLSWFFLNPPKDVWMVGYFLVKRIGWADSERFEESIKSQLIALMTPSFIDEQRIILKERSITQLLDEAALIAQKHNKKLVLIIDGLDENINAGHPSGGSIKRLLIFSRRQWTMIKNRPLQESFSQRCKTSSIMPYMDILLPK